MKKILLTMCLFITISLLVVLFFNLKMASKSSFITIDKGNYLNSLNKKGEIYTIDLDKFNINNKGAKPIETSLGINNALSYAKSNGYHIVKLPTGNYVISETKPIKMLDNLIFDLNQSTIKINPNKNQHSVVVEFTNCKNSTLRNGTVEGDRYEHDYKSIAGSHEWNCGIVLNNCENITVNSIVVKGFAGYGLSSSLGENLSPLQIGITTSNLTIGNITSSGQSTNSTGNIRTIKAMDISAVGKGLELGYNKGYMGYPFLSTKSYDIYYYDRNMKFIKSTRGVKQYKKITNPVGAFYAHFVFHQSNLPTKGDTDFNNTVVFITNYASPTKIHITNCTFEDNRCLGMGLCGGVNFLIEKNKFINNKGGAPGYAVDMEDGWEYMDNFVFKDNVFENNANDVVICAGDNISFIGNQFSSTVYLYPRATNYIIQQNTFKDINMGIHMEFSDTPQIDKNQYINCKVGYTHNGKNGEITAVITNEQLINSSVLTMSKGVKLKNANIYCEDKYSVRLSGTFIDCNIDVKKGDFISAFCEGSTLKNCNVNLQGNNSFNNCLIKDSYINTTNPSTSIDVNNSSLSNSVITVNTWGDSCKINLRNNDIDIPQSPKSFLQVSAGKTPKLILDGNTIRSKSSQPIISIYDTTYSKPNCSISLVDNDFQILNNTLLIEGRPIENGTFKIVIGKNKVNKKDFLPQHYIQKNYVNYIQKIN